jgi:hypothetical protein
MRQLFFLAASALLLAAPRVSGVGYEGDAESLRGIGYAPIEAQQNEPGERQYSDCEHHLHCFTPPLRPDLTIGDPCGRMIYSPL